MVLPTKNGTKSYWIEEANSPLRDYQSSESLPTETDVLIIGSGYTGVSAAYFLYKCTKDLGTTPKILMLEAQDICGGATGRNGGQLRPHAYSRYLPWKALHGPKGAIDLIKHEMAHLSAFDDLLTAASKEPKMSNIKEEVCFQTGSTFDAAMSQEAWSRLKSNYEEIVKDYPDEEIVKELRIIEGAKEAEEFTQIKGSIGAVVHPAGQIWPYKLIHALLTILLNANALSLHAHTPVTHVSPRSPTGWITVTTPRGSILTKTVIHATNAWTNHLLPDFRNLIYPSLATVAALKPHDPDLRLRNTGAQHWDGIVNDYQVQLPPPNTTIVVGGAKKVLVHVPDRWINNVDTSSNIRGVPEYYQSWASSSIIGLESQPKELARDAEDGGCWVGVVGISTDSFPFIGEHPEKEGHFIAAGFTGHGIPSSFPSTSKQLNISNMK
ncbi:hypothetical protein HYFRA_00014040 [Hymenoscyphus fraxineus]|uniref:FAD dependent oxidoreductase domain-containing protein n=1 Tax=Hymenoscyphus fraxineus TaxID=746836 RepID=A0A9N9PPD0_9HELO|nr:hypothetical protein HYFRA_00014040 [Hymenoscyphus fraxineus]